MSWYCKGDVRFVSTPAHWMSMPMHWMRFFLHSWVWVLFCEFLCHSLVQKLFINQSVRRREPPYLLDGNSKDGDHTCSVARAIQATTWKKGLLCGCHYLCCHQPTHIGSHSSHGPTSPMATSMSIPKRRRECHLSVESSCKYMVC